MMRRFVIGSVAVLLFFGWIYGQQSVAPSAGLPYHETRRITPADSILRLNHQFIIAHTERIVLDTTLLSGVSDYFLDTRHGILLLSASHIRSRFPLRDSTAILTIDYRALPFSFKDSYQARVPVVLTDSATGRSILVGKSSGGFTLDDILGSNLQKSGSIVRGFTVGSNRDLSLHSGLRIQRSGNLTPDLL